MYSLRNEKGNHFSNAPTNLSARAPSVNSSSFSLRNSFGFGSQPIEGSILESRPMLTVPGILGGDEPSDDILDKLEQAGRVPSKEKFRRMACNTFIYTGVCPYNDRCVFLHDYRIKTEGAKVRTTRQTKINTTIKDTFYWPDMVRRDVSKHLDAQGLPTANQMYVIPEAFKHNPHNFHNRGLYSMWTHFVEFCIHNNVLVAKRGWDITEEPFFDISNYRDNPHVPKAKRLDIFIHLSMSRPSHRALGTRTQPALGLGNQLIDSPQESNDPNHIDESAYWESVAKKEKLKQQNASAAKIEMPGINAIPGIMQQPTASFSSDSQSIMSRSLAPLNTVSMHPSAQQKYFPEFRTPLPANVVASNFQHVSAPNTWELQSRTEDITTIPFRASSDSYWASSFEHSNSAELLDIPNKDNAQNNAPQMGCFDNNGSYIVTDLYKDDKFQLDSGWSADRGQKLVISEESEEHDEDDATRNSLGFGEALSATFSMWSPVSPKTTETFNHSLPSKYFQEESLLQGALTPIGSNLLQGRSEGQNADPLSLQEHYSNQFLQSNHRPYKPLSIDTSLDTDPLKPSSRPVELEWDNFTAHKGEKDDTDN